MQVRRVHTPAERKAVFAVRREVFQEEQGVDPDLERDARDAHAEHFLVTDGGVAVGAARLVIDEGDRVGLLGRVAVLSASRGTGAGALLVAAAEKQAADLNLVAIELHAQVAVRGFYERLGYVAFGEEFVEAGIRHVSMRKQLPHPRPR